MSPLRRPPQDVRATVVSGERILAWCEVGDEAVVASDIALYLPVPTPLRLPWDLVQTASFEDDVLVVEGKQALEAPVRSWRVTLLAPRSVPEVVHERVRASILASHHVDLTPGGGARIVARRVPGTTGPVRWTVTFDAGLDPRDPRVRALADDALADLRSTLGV